MPTTSCFELMGCVGMALASVCVGVAGVRDGCADVVVGGVEVGLVLVLVLFWVLVVVFGVGVGLCCCC